MKIKRIEGLSSYLFGEDGSVQDLKGNKITLWKDGFKLTTDEFITVKGGVKMPIVRRFQPEDVKKLFDGPKSSVFTMPTVDNPKGIVVDVKTTGLSNNNSIEEGSTLTEEQFKILQDRSDKTAASKRVVKSNPKASKAKQKKVSKAIKATTGKAKKVEPGVQLPGSDIPPVAGTLPEGFSYPYILINGTPYQSARKASAAGHGSVNTVLKRAKANKDGYFYIEK